MPQKLPHTGGIYVVDYNRDGIQDLLVNDIDNQVLYQGLPGGGFKDVSREVGLPPAPPTIEARYAGFTDLVFFADLDGDGWEDMVFDQRVYKNDQGKRFIDVTKKSNLIGLFHNSTSTSQGGKRQGGDFPGGAVIGDYDRDGKIDLYLVRSAQLKADSWLDGRSEVGSAGNILLHNLGNWQFEDVTLASGTDGGKRSVFSAAWLDANNDDWPDLYVINEFGAGQLLVNQKDGTFHAQSLVPGPGDFGSMGLTTGDVDNDGNIDLYIGNMYSKAGTRVIGNLLPDAYPASIMTTMKTFVAGSQLYLNRGNLKFDKVGKERQVAAVGWAYGPTLADLDNDGFLDLYATAGFVSDNRDDPDG
jgi:hypothetical protein